MYLFLVLSQLVTSFFYCSFQSHCLDNLQLDLDLLGYTLLTLTPSKWLEPNQFGYPEDLLFC